MRDLLTPPGHRGPLISAGAVVLAVGVALEQFRITPGVGVQFLVMALVAALFLWLALQGEMEDADPPPWMSVLLVAGLVALYGALLRLADLLGASFAEDFPAGTFIWTGLLEMGAAWFACRRRGSGIALLIAAIAWGTVVLSLYDWVFGPHSVTPYRWLLLLLAIVYAIASLSVRGRRQRFCEQFANAGGVAILAIAAASSGFISGVGGLPTFWELVLLAFGLGLVAYAAADGAPGPAYLGVLNLVAFVAYAASEDSLLWWPLLLLLLGGAMMVIGLRPRVPLPPPPVTSTSPGDQPLAARSDGDT